jgi:hypothetical protein
MNKIKIKKKHTVGSHDYLYNTYGD